MKCVFGVILIVLAGAFFAWLVFVFAEPPWPEIAKEYASFRVTGH